MKLLAYIVLSLACAAYAVEEIDEIESSNRDSKQLLFRSDLGNYVHGFPHVVTSTVNPPVIKLTDSVTPAVATHIVTVTAGYPQQIPSVIFVTATDYTTVTAVQTKATYVTVTTSHIVTSYVTHTQTNTRFESVTYTVLVTPQVERTYTTVLNAGSPSAAGYHHALPIIQPLEVANPPIIVHTYPAGYAAQTPAPAPALRGADLAARQALQQLYLRTKFNQIRNQQGRK